jgi:DNA-binding MarR family transcriptional regulator
VAQGREAARTLDRWVEPLGLSETEFRLLWALLLRAGAPRTCTASHEAPDLSLDQTQLAAQLAASPAQVSASVVRLQGQGWVLGGRPQANRRRQVWQLTDDGRHLLDLTLRRLAADAPLAAQPTHPLEEVA